jgi:hypothetical protein
MLLCLKSKEVNVKDTVDEPSFLKPEKADWLEESGAEELDADQQALLLALAQLEAEMGRELSKSEKDALDTLGKNLSSFDSQEIAQAVKKVVNAPTDPDRVISWPELKHRSE